ncbi:MAG: hypothetical protein Q4G16_03145 [Cruoricaptor ignavus]|nr:hypothetical protein [Cruoricaptor ignavus]
MKKLIFTAMAFAVIGCNQNKKTEQKDDLQLQVDSINQARAKYNDSIQALNEANRFGDLSGSKTLSYKSDDSSININGTINFQKTGRDLYDISGNASSGKNTISINGTIKRVSEKHLNFEGEISQNINGSAYKRTKKTTFLNEGKGKFWRLQDKVNADGFVDYIDIKE